MEYSDPEYKRYNTHQSKTNYFRGSCVFEAQRKKIKVLKYFLSAKQKNNQKSGDGTLLGITFLVFLQTFVHF